MAPAGINLLKNRRVLSEKAYQEERKFLRYSVLALVLTAVVAVALSLINLYLMTRISTLDTTITSASSKISGLSKASAQQIYLKSRLQLISGYLENRSTARTALQQIFSLSIPGAEVTGASFPSDQTLAVQVTANSIVALNQVVAYYQASNAFFTQAVSNGITRAKDGTYQLQIILSLPKNGS